MFFCETSIIFLLTDGIKVFAGKDVTNGDESLIYANINDPYISTKVLILLFRLFQPFFSLFLIS